MSFPGKFPENALDSTIHLASGRSRRNPNPRFLPQLGFTVPIQLPFPSRRQRMSIGDAGRREPASGRFTHLQSLPRGFRFHPTDEELINHYLKGKIDGTLSSEPEVIPEVDVCKCEPWDLPDRSLIRSTDPEWFFFAPKDRKYANGHRSNRATAAGYWKATGKDRVIRSRPSGVVGMKKTLVFHSGRAPKGSRTNWIMHEYRTTQDEYESGEQGGYVLYRLFKKLEDRSSSPNLDAVERSDLSPTPPKPSPSDTQQEPDASEEFTTPVNEDTPQSGMHEVQQSLASIVNSQPSVMERGLADKSECSTTSPVKLKEILCNGIMSSDQGVQKAGVEGKVDSLLNVLLQSSDPQFEWTDSDGFPTISSPVLPYADYPFFGSNDQGSLLELYGDGNPQEDSLNKLLSTALSNQDDYSAEFLYPLETPFSEMGPDDNAATACMPIWNSAPSINGGWGSDVDKNAGLLQRSTNLEYSVWSGRPPVLSNGYSEMNPNVSNVYENTGYLSDDIPGKDIYSASESLQELVNDMKDPSCRRISNNNGDGLVTTGIKIMAREPQNLPNSNIAMHLNVESRIGLQCWADVETSCDCTTSNFNKDDNENKGPEVEEEKHQENDNAERSFFCESDESNNREDNEDKVVASECLQVEDKTGNNDFERPISCMSTGSSTTADLEDNGAKIAERDNVEDCNDEEVSGPVDLDKLKDFSIIDDTRNTKPTSSSMFQETEPTLRIRRKWNVIAGCRLSTSSLQQKAPNVISVVAYLTRSVPVMTILLLLSAGIWSCLSLYYF